MKSHRFFRIAVAPVAIASILAVTAGRSAAGVIAYVPISSEADSGISTDNFYTHLLDFGTGDGGALINGVQFRRSTVGDLPPHFTYAVNSGSRSDHDGDGGHNVSGQVVNLFRDMVYNSGNSPGGVATLGLSNLVPGYEYDLRVYTRAWGGSAGTRVATFGFDTNNDGVPNDTVTINQDDATANPPGFADWNQAYALSYRFTADSPEANVTLTQPGDNRSWHLYGLSNEVVGGPALAVANASFEQPAMSTGGWSYLAEGQLPGWNIGGTADRVGVAQQGSPWANNGTIPDGDQVGYIQSNNGTGTLSQQVFGLEAGETYRLSYRYNARSGSGREHPEIRVSVDGNVLQHTLYNRDGVGGANPYFLGAYEFVATGATATLLFENTRSTGDSAVLLDAVRVEPAASNGWRIAPWSNDATSGIDASRHYTHAINVQSTSTATVNGVAFKPSGTGANPAEGPGGANYTTSGMGSTANRAHNITDPGSQALAAAFRHGGATSGFTLSGLLPGQTYETTVFGVAWDALPYSRRATFSVNGSEPVTFDESMYDNNNGVRFTYRGQADQNGQITLDVAPHMSDRTWHYYAFSNAFIRPTGMPGGMIIGDAFAGSNGADNGLRIHQRAPDHANLPGAPAYVETGLSAHRTTRIDEGRAEVGANAGAGIPLESTGDYNKPPGVRIEAYLSPYNLAQEADWSAAAMRARGVGLGFYDFTTDPGSRPVAIGFSGLVLAPDGHLYAYSNTGDALDDALYSSPIPFGGTFDPDASYKLSYEVDFGTGSISNIFLDGSTADYRPLADFAAGWFDDDATRMAAFTGSSSIGGRYGYVDNFIVTAIPEPGAWLLLLTALGCGLLVRRRR